VGIGRCGQIVSSTCPPMPLLHVEAALVEELLSSAAFPLGTLARLLAAERAKPAARFDEECVEPGRWAAAGGVPATRRCRWLLAVVAEEIDAQRDVCAHRRLSAPALSHGRRREAGEP